MKEGACLKSPLKILTKTARFLLLLLLYPAAQVLWFGSHVVVFSSVVVWKSAFMDPRYKMWHVFTALSSQLWAVVVSCCAEVVVGQLPFWFLLQMAGFYHVLCVEDSHFDSYFRWQASIMSCVLRTAILILTSDCRLPEEPWHEANHWPSCWNSKKDTNHGERFSLYFNQDHRNTKAFQSLNTL